MLRCPWPAPGARYPIPTDQVEWGAHRIEWAAQPCIFVDREPDGTFSFGADWCDSGNREATAHTDGWDIEISGGWVSLIGEALDERLMAIRHALRDPGLCVSPSGARLAELVAPFFTIAGCDSTEPRQEG